MRDSHKTAQFNEFKITFVIFLFCFWIMALLLSIRTGTNLWAVMVLPTMTAGGFAWRSWKNLGQIEPTLPEKPASPPQIPKVKIKEPPTVVIVGTLTRKIFKNEDGTYCIYVCKLSRSNEVTVIYRGNNPPKTYKTVQYVMKCQIVNHPKYGKNYKIIEYERYRRRPAEHIEQAKLIADAKKTIGG